MVKAYSLFEDWVESKYASELANIQTPEDMEKAMDRILAKEISRLSEAKVRRGIFQHYAKNAGEFTVFRAGDKTFVPINAYDAEGNLDGSSSIGERIAEGQANLLAKHLNQLQRINVSQNVDRYRNIIRDDQNNLGDAHEYLQDRAADKQRELAANEVEVRSRIEFRTRALREQEIESSIQSAQYGKVTASFKEDKNSLSREIDEVNKEIRTIQKSKQPNIETRVNTLLLEKDKKELEVKRLEKNRSIAEEIIKISQAKVTKQKTITIRGVDIPISQNRKPKGYTINIPEGSEELI